VVKSFPKHGDLICKKYLDWVRSLWCRIGEGCEGDLIAHHVQRRSKYTDDLTTICLCVRHHHELHAGNLKDRNWEHEEMRDVLVLAITTAPVDVLEAIVESRRKRMEAVIF
jgi:hypothetical protein